MCMPAIDPDADEFFEDGAVGEVCSAVVRAVCLEPKFPPNMRARTD